MFDELFQRAGLSLDRLRSFLRVAEAGAIARAAPGDPVRQSQYSRQIAELEESLGLPLVERRGRGLALTAPGERLAVVVREALQGLTDVAASSAERSVAASLCAGDSMLHPWVIPAITRLLARTPNTNITLTAVGDRDAIARVVDARSDFAILRAHTMPSGLRSRRLGAIEYALFVPRALRSRGRRMRRDDTTGRSGSRQDAASSSGTAARSGSRGATAALSGALGSASSTGSPDAIELLGELPLAAQYGDAELAAALDSTLRAARQHVVPALVCETFPQAQRAVMTGRFAAVLPSLARLDLPARDFDEVPVPGLPSITVVLAWHRRIERQRPRVAALVPKLVETLALTS